MKKKQPNNLLEYLNKQDFSGLNNFDSNKLQRLMKNIKK